MTDDWSRLLTAFENALDEHATPTAWSAPSTPLPADEADRAANLLRRQRERMRQLSALRDDVRSQLEAIGRIPTAGADTPGFLDEVG